MSQQTFDTLSEYGKPFQTKTITLLLNDPQFLEQIKDILHPTFYDSDSYKWIVKTKME